VTAEVGPPPRVGPMSRDVAVNVVGKLWSAGISLAFVPIYVHVLGIEAYGLVAVFTTLRNLFLALDLGLTTTLNRELARRHAGDAGDARNLVRTLESLYWLLAALIVLLCAVLSPWIARGFVHAESLSQERVIGVLRLMGVVIGFEWLLSFYAGGLMGLHRQVLYNVCYAALSTLRYAGVLPLLFFVSPTVEVFFAWQAGVGVLGAAVIGRALWRSLPAGPSPRFQARIVRSVWHFAAGMSAVSLTGLVVGQLDRVVVARLVSLSDLGYYGLGLTFAGLLFGFINPIYSAVFPRLSTSVAQGDVVSLAAQYHRGCQLMSVAVLPAGAVICLFSSEILQLWTRDATAVERTWPLLSVMAVSTSLNGLLTVPYALLLAHGHTRISLYTHVIAIVGLTPLIVWATLRYGILGASVGWAVYNLLSLTIGMVFVHRLFLQTEGWRWFRDDVGRPGAVAMLAVAAGRLIVPPTLPAEALAAALVSILALATVATARSVPEVWHPALALWSAFRPKKA
jgi:O-antigen/teichoic acid export membrane protein